MDSAPKITIVGKFEGSYVQKILQKYGSPLGKRGDTILQQQTAIINEVTEKIVKDLDIHLIDLPYYVLALGYLATSFETQLDPDQEEFCKTYRMFTQATTFVQRKVVRDKEETEDE